MGIKDYPARLTTGYYRVRETWEDAASQLGAYRLLANAIAKADANPSYFVFSNEGEAIYPEPESGIEEAAEVPEKSSGEAEPANDSTEDTTDAEADSENQPRTGMTFRRPRKPRTSLSRQILQQTMSRKLLNSQVPEPRQMLRKMRPSRKLWSMSMTAMTRLSPTRS